METRSRRLPGQCECSVGWCACCRESKASWLIGSNLSLSVSLFVSISLPLSPTNLMDIISQTQMCCRTPPFLKSKMASHFQACFGGGTMTIYGPDPGRMSHHSHSCLPESLEAHYLTFPESLQCVGVDGREIR